MVQKIQVITHQVMYISSIEVIDLSTDNSRVLLRKTLGTSSPNFEFWWEFYIKDATAMITEYSIYTYLRWVPKSILSDSEQETYEMFRKEWQVYCEFDGAAFAKKCKLPDNNAAEYVERSDKLDMLPYEKYQWGKPIIGEFINDGKTHTIQVSMRLLGLGEPLYCPSITQLNKTYNITAPKYIVPKPEAESGTVKVKVNGEWKTGVVYVKVDGTWHKSKSILIKQGDGWKASTD